MRKLLAALALAGALFTTEIAGATCPKPGKGTAGKASTTQTCSKGSTVRKTRASSNSRIQRDTTPPNVARNNGPFDQATADSLYMYGRMPYGGIVDTTYHPEAHQQRER